MSPATTVTPVSTSKSPDPSDVGHNTPGRIRIISIEVEDTETSIRNSKVNRAVIRLQPGHNQTGRDGTGTLNGTLKLGTAVSPVRQVIRVEATSISYVVRKQKPRVIVGTRRNQINPTLRVDSTEGRSHIRTLQLNQVIGDHPSALGRSRQISLKTGLAILTSNPEPLQGFMVQKKLLIH
jgi:hypothetical protein